MNLSFSKEDLDFKQEVVDFLDSNYPGDIKERQDKRLPLDKEQNIRWQKILSKKGWFAVNWPSEYSGSPELSLTQKYILQNVLAEYNTPVLLPFGVGMCAPVIFSFGTDKQKNQHLPAILNSDVWWCQGYSEPGSGSDLASLKTKADKEGDNYIVNGCKTWT